MSGICDFTIFILISVIQNPRLYEDRDFRVSPSNARQMAASSERPRLQIFKRNTRRAERALRNNVSDEETSGSTDVHLDGRSKTGRVKSKDIFKPPTPENSSPE